MAIYADSFIFDSKSCLAYGLMICEFNASGGVKKSSAGSSISLETIKLNNKWLQVGNKYSEALKFSFQVCKMDESEITSWEQEAISRWLIRKDKYNYLQFVQPDYEQIFYNVQCTSIDVISCGSKNVGLEFTFVSDAPYGYSQQYTKIYDMGSSTLTDTFVDLSSEVGETYPDMSIYFYENCNFQIINALTGSTFKINNCKLGETITIKSETGEIISNLINHNALSDFNFGWFRFANTLTTRKNNLTFTGRAKVTLIYRLIKKVGV